MRRELALEVRATQVYWRIPRVGQLDELRLLGDDIGRVMDLIDDHAARQQPAIFESLNEDPQHRRGECLP